MTNKTVILIIIIAVVVFAAIVFFPKHSLYRFQKTTEITPPPATGDVDDLVDATLSEISDENLLIKEEEKDTSLISSDNQMISDFGQTINESEF